MEAAIQILEKFYKGETNVISVEEQALCIEYYIKQLKGVIVKLAIPHPQEIRYRGPFGIMEIIEEFQNINNAFDVVLGWYAKTKVIVNEK